MGLPRVEVIQTFNGGNILGVLATVPALPCRINKAGEPRNIVTLEHNLLTGGLNLGWRLHGDAPLTPRDFLNMARPTAEDVVRFSNRGKDTYTALRGRALRAYAVLRSTSEVQVVAPNNTSARMLYYDTPEFPGAISIDTHAWEQAREYASKFGAPIVANCLSELVEQLPVA